MQGNIIYKDITLGDYGIHFALSKIFLTDHNLVVSSDHHYS